MRNELGQFSRKYENHLQGTKGSYRAGCGHVAKRADAKQCRSCWALRGHLPLTRGYRRSDGYWMRSVNGVEVMEHRLIVERTYPNLPSGAVVHHIDCDPTNNDPGNLLICTQAYHHQLHWRMGELYAQEKFGGKK